MKYYVILKIIKNLKNHFHKSLVLKNRFTTKLVGIQIKAFYKKQAEKIYKPLEKLKNKLKRLDDILTKLKLFMFAQILQSEDQCDKLENAANSSNDLIIPDPTGPTELEEYMSFLNDHYKDVYDNRKWNFAVRVRPTPAACMDPMNILVLGSVWNVSTACCRVV